jgi:hypothetical protein
MISAEHARALRDAGVTWVPSPGDAFRIDTPEFDGETFTVSDMTIEPHQFDTGTILGFNGTTEWALDSVALEDALWLPREDQLRELLGTAFRSLKRVDGGYRTDAAINGSLAYFYDSDPADAYAQALLALVATTQLTPTPTE